MTGRWIVLLLVATLFPVTNAAAQNVMVYTSFQDSCGPIASTDPATTPPAKFVPMLLAHCSTSSRGPRVAQ
jgi:hypothetical protein